MNHHLFIIDDDLEYSAKLSAYLNSKDGFPFMVKCVSQDALSKDNKVDPELIVVDDKIFKSAKGNFYKENTIVLTDNATQEIDGIKYLSKYRSSESIAKDILRYSADMEFMGSFINRKSTLKIYGFYSPIKHCGQSTLSRELGRELSKRSSTLFLSLESYSGLETIQGRRFDKDLGDLIYSYESGRSNMGAVLGSIVENIEGVDTIPPMKGHDELSGITIWPAIISMIETYSDYEYLIIDISDAVSNLETILNLANKIITIEDDTVISTGKMTDYEEILLKRGREDIINKTIKWQVSKEKSNVRQLMNKLLNGE